MVPPSQADTRAPVRSTRQALAVYAERPTLVVMALGFAAGLPFLLIFDTLSAWLRDVGLSLEVIGFFSLATLVYSFKFLWAPLVDRTRVPWLTRRLGHRRSWMLACQIPIIVGLWLVSGRSPADELGLMAILAVLVGCFRHQLLLPSPYLVLTKPLRLDIQCQRGASVKIGWKYLDD